MWNDNVCTLTYNNMTLGTTSFRSAANLSRGGRVCLVIKNYKLKIKDRDNEEWSPRVK